MYIWVYIYTHVCMLCVFLFFGGGVVCGSHPHANQNTRQQIPFHILEKGGSLAIAGILNVMVPRFVKILSKVRKKKDKFEYDTYKCSTDGIEANNTLNTRPNAAHWRNKSQ